MLDTKSNIKFLDMKGDMSGTLSTNGDTLRDYYKTYQYLCVFEYIVNDLEIDEKYLAQLREHYLKRLSSTGYAIKIVKAITSCLVDKTISFFELNSKYKKEIWEISTKLSKSI